MTCDIRGRRYAWNTPCLNRKCSMVGGLEGGGCSIE